jgi:large subunit ribosomal protein L29
MKKKAHDLREMTLTELESMARERAEELMQMRIKLRLRQIDNPLSVRNARRELAVIKTVMNEKRAG